jgi:hypothetical protein
VEESRPRTPVVRRVKQATEVQGRAEKEVGKPRMHLSSHVPGVGDRLSGGRR